MPNSETRYIDKCILDIKMCDNKNLKMLHSLAVKNKVDTVKFFIDSNNMFIVFESYLTGSIIFHKVNCTINEIFVIDCDGNKINTRIDNTKYEEPASQQSASTPNIFDTVNQTMKNINQKTYIRFSATTSILKALSFYKGENVYLNIDQTILITEGTMHLAINRPRMFDKLEDYLAPFTNINWDKLNISGVNSIARALLTTKDTVYKMYIAIEDEKIYSHNTSFLIEKESFKVNNKYILPYVSIDTIKLLSPKESAFIGKKDNSIVIESEDTLISWTIDVSMDETSNLMSVLNRNNFIRIASINKDELDKITVLAEYSDDPSNKEVNIVIENGRITAEKWNNFTVLKANSASHNVSFKVRIDSLLVAKQLAGANPILYLDKTGKDNVLILYHEMLVAIAISDIKIGELKLSQRSLADTIKSLNDKKNTSTVSDEEAVGMDSIVIDKNCVEMDSVTNTDNIPNIDDIEISDEELDAIINMDLDDMVNPNESDELVPVSFNVPIIPPTNSNEEGETND